MCVCVCVKKCDDVSGSILLFQSYGVSDVFFLSIPCWQYKFPIFHCSKTWQHTHTNWRDSINTHEEWVGGGGGGGGVDKRVKMRIEWKKGAAADVLQRQRTNLIIWNAIFDIWEKHEWHLKACIQLPIYITHVFYGVLRQMCFLFWFVIAFVRIASCRYFVLHHIHTLTHSPFESVILITFHSPDTNFKRKSSFLLMLLWLVMRRFYGL